MRPLPLATGLILATSALSSAAGAQQNHVAGQFDLVITKSPVLTVGKHHVEVTDATASLTTVLRGRVNASKIEMTSHDRTKAIFLFLLDSADRITQANLTIVVPGSTVVRTIAWTPADLDKYFSNAHRSNGRLRLVSKGTYDSKDLANAALVMSWDVDLDVSVDERPNPS
jgi:hypothetical protein